MQCADTLYTAELLHFFITDKNSSSCSFFSILVEEIPRTNTQVFGSICIYMEPKFSNSSITESILMTSFGFN